MEDKGSGTEQSKTRGMHEIICRKKFIVAGAKYAGGAICMGALGALLGCGPKRSASAEDEKARPGDEPTYGRGILMGIFTEQLPYYTQVITKNKDKGTAERVEKEARADYEELIVDIPYVGDVRYPLPNTLIESAVALSFHGALEKNGIKGEAAGDIIADAAEASIRAVPEEERAAAGEQQFSEGWYQLQKYAAGKSQEKLYPGDWVFEFVEGVPGEFDWGWDFAECGILKFYEAQDATKLMPYLCYQDFTASELENTGLERTTTLAKGGKVCDFRYKQGRKVEPKM